MGEFVRSEIGRNGVSRPNKDRIDLDSDQVGNVGQNDCGHIQRLNIRRIGRINRRCVRAISSGHERLRNTVRSHVKHTEIEFHIVQVVIGSRIQIHVPETTNDTGRRQNARGHGECSQQIGIICCLDAGCDRRQSRSIGKFGQGACLRCSASSRVQEERETTRNSVESHRTGRACRACVPCPACRSCWPRVSSHTCRPRWSRIPCRARRPSHTCRPRVTSGSCITCRSIQSSIRK